MPQARIPDRFTGWLSTAAREVLHAAPSAFEACVPATHNSEDRDGEAPQTEDIGNAFDKMEDEATANARRFVAIALDGGFSEAHRQAARTGPAVAIEHGFQNDVKRVAEALVVFLPPEHR